MPCPGARRRVTTAGRAALWRWIHRPARRSGGGGWENWHIGENRYDPASTAASSRPAHGAIDDDACVRRAIAASRPGFARGSAGDAATSPMPVARRACADGPAMRIPPRRRRYGYSELGGCGGDARRGRRCRRRRALTPGRSQPCGKTLIDPAGSSSIARRGHDPILRFGSRRPGAVSISCCSGNVATSADKCMRSIVRADL
ncbi:hypothetical protein SEVIR_6G215275v4 [Setaria viridis]